MAAILEALGSWQMIEGKILISALPGKSAQATLRAVAGEEVLGDAEEHSGITLEMTMPNLVAREGASMTTMAASTYESSQRAMNATKWVLDHVGKRREIPEAQFDLIGSLAGCSGAILTIAIMSAWHEDRTLGGIVNDGAFYHCSSMAARRPTFVSRCPPPRREHDQEPRGIGTT
ncbi:unnamed protein product [Clonostachys solani]|uniref:Uncharacterized protein n=1 Tax=Clonostachys solani TaxID=160281 RepID=A0A9N9YZT3_9HYPO|nr:unnamed protein product [Clonostachys solani]